MLDAVIKNVKNRIPFLKPKESNVQALPFLQYDDYLKLKDGSYRCILRVSAINNELLSEEENDQVIESLQEAINAIPGVQQITVSSERLNLDEYLDYLNKKYEATRDAFHLERLSEKIKDVRRYSNNQTTKKTFYVTICSVNSDFQRTKEDFEEHVKQIEESLSAAEIYISLLSNDEGKKMLYEKLNPITSLLQPYRNGMSFKAMAPAPIIDNTNYLQLDGMFYRFYTIVDYPLGVKPGWMSKIFNVRGSVDTSIILSPTGKREVIGTLDKAIGEINFRLHQAALKESEKIELEKDKKSNINLLEEISGENENLYNVSLVIAVKERSLKDLDTSCDRLQTAIGSARMRSRQLVMMGYDPLWLTLPIAYPSPYLKHKALQWPMQTSIIGSILPFNSSDIIMKTGVVKGKNPNTDSLIIVDRRDRHAVDNPNEVVIAPSGRGKSWYAKADILRELSQGTKVIVIDPDREYMFNYGERVVFSIGSKYCTNPFHIRSAVVDLEDEQDDSESYAEDVGQFLQRKIADLIPFFKWIYPTMNSTEEAELTEVMRIMYEDRSGLTFESKKLPEKYPTMSDLDDMIERHFKDSLGNLRTNIRPYVTGIYKDMFNGQTNWSMDTQLTILDINTLSESVQRPMMHLLLMDIWEYIKIDREEKKGIYVDEAWKLASPDNPQTLKFLFEIAKRIRKYGGYLTTITQNISDFFNTGEKNYGQAIFDNAFFKLFLGLSEKDYKTLEDTGFIFSKKENRILKKRKSKGRGVYMVGSTRVEIQTTPTMDELQFIDPKEYQKLRALEKDEQVDMEIENAYEVDEEAAPS
jgi:conjugal transfer ATP-binding protein TraC